MCPCNSRVYQTIPTAILEPQDANVFSNRRAGSNLRSVYIITYKYALFSFLKYINMSASLRLQGYVSYCFFWCILLTMNSTDIALMLWNLHFDSSLDIQRPFFPYLQASVGEKVRISLSANFPYSG